MYRGGHALGGASAKIRAVSQHAPRVIRAAAGKCLVRAGSPSITELEDLGVARASTASRIALMAAAITRQITEELKSTGRFAALNSAKTQADLNPRLTGACFDCGGAGLGDGANVIA